MAVIEWKAPEQKHPLLFRVKPKKSELAAITAKDVDVKHIKRSVELSAQPLDDTGQLYFEIVKGAWYEAQMFWAHLTDPDYLIEIKYPSGNKVEKPRGDKVVVHKGQDKVVIEVDQVHYAFLHGETADPLIKDEIKDPKELIVALVVDQLNRPDRPAKK